MYVGIGRKKVQRKLPALGMEQQRGLPWFDKRGTEFERENAEITEKLCLDFKTRGVERAMQVVMSCEPCDRIIHVQR